MKKYEPNEEDRKKVENYTAVGIIQEDVARVIGIDPKTLRLYYRDELDTSAIKANAAVGGKLYSKAMAGDTASLIWWSKSRNRWSEKKEHELSGGIDQKHTLDEDGKEFLKSLLEK